MNRRTRDALYLVLAAVMIIVAVRRFRALASRPPEGGPAERAGTGFAGAGYGAAEYLGEFPRQIGTSSNRLRQKEGRTLLWAKGNPASDKAEWFDVTGAPIAPGEFQYGIGKDTIRAIDEPQFVSADDPRLAELNITDNSRVIGYTHGERAKAYPIRILNRHELVNDNVGGKPVTVGW